MAELNELTAAENPLDEQLTAYLDGELTPEEARAMEQRLARDVQARERLRELAGAWDLLDKLPRSTVNENFAKTTVAMVAVAAAEEVQALQQAAPVSKFKRWMWSITGILAAGILGFLLTYALWPNAQERLVAELGLIENWQLYQEVGDVEFLRKLDQAGLFWNVNTTVETSPTVPLQDNERTQYLAQLSDSQRVELRRKLEELHRLPLSEQQQLKQLDQDLTTANDAQRLNQIMQSYHNWLNARSPLEVADLRKLSAEYRIKRIQELQKSDEEQWVKTYRFPSTMTDDFRRIFTWLVEVAKQRATDIEAKMSEKQREAYDKLPKEARERSLLFNWFDQEFRKRRDETLANLSEEQRSQIEKSSPERMRYFMMQWMRTNPNSFRRPPLPFTEDEIANLAQRLSEFSRTQLKQFEAKPNSTDAERQKLLSDRNSKLWEWIGDAMRFAFVSRSFVTERELQEYFANLPEEVKSELLLQTPEDLKQELRRRYMQENAGFAGGMFGGRPGEPGGGMRPGGEFRPGEHRPGDPKQGEFRPGGGPDNRQPRPNGEGPDPNKGGPRPPRDGRGEFGPPPKDDRPPPKDE